MFALYGPIAFGTRTVAHLRRTGDTDSAGSPGAPGSPEWRAGVLFIASLAAGVTGPVAGLWGVPEIPVVTGTWAQSIGVGLTPAGIVGTFLIQLAMGESRRIGVDETEPTPLVTSGPFRVVRTPSSPPCSPPAPESR